MIIDLKQTKVNTKDVPNTSGIFGIFGVNNSNKIILDCFYTNNIAKDINIFYLRIKNIYEKIDNIEKYDWFNKYSNYIKDFTKFEIEYKEIPNMTRVLGELSALDFILKNSVYTNLASLSISSNKVKNSNYKIIDLFEFDQYRKTSGVAAIMCDNICLNVYQNTDINKVVTKELRIIKDDILNNNIGAANYTINRKVKILIAENSLHKTVKERKQILNDMVAELKPIYFMLNNS